MWAKCPCLPLNGEDNPVEPTPICAHLTLKAMTVQQNMEAAVLFEGMKALVKYSMAYFRFKREPTDPTPSGVKGIHGLADGAEFVEGSIVVSDRGTEPGVSTGGRKGLDIGILIGGRDALCRQLPADPGGRLDEPGI